MQPRIHIALPPGRSYTIGETVQGTVQIQSGFPSATGLDVQLLTHKRGAERKEWARVRVHHGPLSHGMQLPFSLQIPLDAPFAFEGKRHAASWVVRAQVDVPWKIDPKAEVALSVGPRAVRAAEIAQVVQLPEKPESKMSPFLWVLLSLLVLVIGVSVAVTFLPFAPFLLIYLANRRALATRLSDLTIELPERHFVLGEWVPVTVRCRLKRAVDLERMTLLFQGTEKWSTGSGNSRRTHYHHFHEQQLLGLSNTVIAPVSSKIGAAGGVYRSAGRPRIEGPFLVWETAVQLPVDGLPTSRGVYYKLQAKLELRGLPHATLEKKVPTVSARLIERPATPHLLPVAETSGQLVFVPEGATPPAGVDASVRGGGVMRWVLLTTAGLAGLAGAAFLASLSLTMGVGAGLLALLLTAGGLFGYWSALYR